MKNGIGLVIAGGGGKGAYFIGVWKALKEYGVDLNITDISGTSVGALNAVLFAQGDYNLAEKIWLNINTDDILTFDIKKIIFGVAGLGVSKMLIQAAIPIIIGSYGSSIFSREGLLKIIEDNVDLNSIRYSEKNIYAAAYNTECLDIEYFKLNNESDDDIKDMLLASSALPVIFKRQQVKGKGYYDGGLKDNVPLMPLYDKGVRNFIIVHLSRDSMIDRDRFKGANIIEIVPNESQGNLLTGTLDFSKEGALKRINQGYKDTVNMLKPIYEMGIVQKKINNTLNKLVQDNTKFNFQRKTILTERNNLKQELNGLLNNK